MQAQLEKVAAGKDKKLAAEATKVRQELAPLLGGRGPADLGNAGGVLTNLEADLEAADGPPTAIQKEFYAGIRDQAEVALALWESLRALLSDKLQAAAAKEKVALLPDELLERLSRSTNEDEP